MKSYWFQLHGGDFLNEVSSLDIDEIGCYIMLKIYCLKNSVIPIDEKKLSMICKGAKIKTICNALELFKATSEGYIHEELEEYKVKCKRIAEARKIAGAKGANKRWKG